jgi:hypothetical protein
MSISQLSSDATTLIRRLCCVARPLIVVALTHACFAQTHAPRLVSVKRIWDRAPHSAFTDLARYQDHWYCTFREGAGHVGGDGKIRVLTSADGDAWESCALLAEEGIDLRDPKLCITVDNQLMLVAGGSVYEGTTTLKGMQPRVAFSPDGRKWTSLRRVLSEGQWLWRVTWHEGRAYGVSYRVLDNASTPLAEWELTLVASDDGVNFSPITRLEVPSKPNETTLRFLATGELMALVRRDGGNRLGWIGLSRPPTYQQWTWKETNMQLGGPNFIQLPDRSLWAGTRDYAGSLRTDATQKGVSTVLAYMTRDAIEPLLLLPSGGDTSYPGLAWHDNLLWMSYYSSHEGKAGIYLAKIRLEE